MNELFEVFEGKLKDVGYSLSDSYVFDRNIEDIEKVMDAVSVADYDLDVEIVENEVHYSADANEVYRSIMPKGKYVPGGDFEEQLKLAKTTIENIIGFDELEEDVEEAVEVLEYSIEQADNYLEAFSKIEEKLNTLK